MEDATLTAAEETICTVEGRVERIEKLTKNHVLASMGVGLIPVPFVDLAAVMGIQLDMIKKLSAEYDIPFKKDIGKSVIATLAGGFIPTAFGGAISSMVKFIPVIGTTTGAITMPVFCGASTYAIGKVFVQHFESGGTFLDLDPSKVKAYFADQFSKGKKVASDLTSSASPDKAAA